VPRAFLHLSRDDLTAALIATPFEKQRANGAKGRRKGERELELGADESDIDREIRRAISTKIFYLARYSIMQSHSPLLSLSLSLLLHLHDVV